MSEGSRDGGESPRDDMCVICFAEDESNLLVSGPCGHILCLTCAERLLNAPRALSARNEMQRMESNIITTTLGLCPVCRAELSYFDLKYMESGAEVCRGEADSWIRSPLAGAVYAETGPHGGVGWGSFHFPKPDEANTSETHVSSSQGPGNEKEEPSVPYFNAENAPSTRDYLPFQDIHYHAATRTFQGRNLLPKEDPFEQIRVILSFSDDMRFVARGVMIQHPREPTPESDFGSLYLFDGKWFVRHDGRLICQLDVTRSRVCVDDSMYKLERDVERNAIRCVDMLNEEISVAADWNWEERPDGPEVGDVLQWCHPSNGEVPPFIHSAEWSRQTDTSGTSWQQPIVMQLGGNSGRLYKRVEGSHDQFIRPAPTYNPNSACGNVFCQALRVGMASYHFVSEQDIYISYEHPEALRWPPLDNGMPIPSRVRFHNISWPDSHTFHGQICWLQDYGTGWQGMIRWDYKMKFDTEYMCISSGNVKSVSADTDEPRELSRYGQDLVYCNAALYDVFRQQVPSSHNGQTFFEAFREQSDALRKRLREEGVSVRTAAMVHHVLTAAQVPNGSNPVDYNQ